MYHRTAFRSQFTKYTDHSLYKEAPTYHTPQLTAPNPHLSLPLSLRQISPVLLTAPLISRLHNNLLVVEVWQRCQTPGQDRLVGLSRVPLERLYLTFSQPEVTETVLQMKVHSGGDGDCSGVEGMLGLCQNGTKNKG